MRKGLSWGSRDKESRDSKAPGSSRERDLQSLTEEFCDPQIWTTVVAMLCKTNSRTRRSARLYLQGFPGERKNRLASEADVQSCGGLRVEVTT